jgi:general secretion pathway protein F
VEFSYKAVDKSGQLLAGTLQAASQAGALNELARMQLVPVDVRGNVGLDASAPFLKRFRSGRRLSTRDVVALTLGLASLLKAGLVLDRALNILAATSDRPGIRALCTDLERKVRAGSTFGSALQAEQRVFPRYYITMARAGELGGSLADGLERLGAFVERAASVRERIIGSLIYPAMLAGMILLTVVLVLTVVLPRFKTLFDESQVQLPWATRGVLALGDFVSAYGWYCAAATVLGVIALTRAWLDPNTGPRLDMRLLRARCTFGLIAKTQTSRFLRTIGTLSRNGVPLPQATSVALGMLHNRALLAAATEVHERLKQGHDLSMLLDRAAVFPKAAVQLARVGEETGRLQELLVEAADTLDREAQDTIDRLLSVLVPGITIVMGAIVAALIASVLVGILSLNDLAF